MTAPAAFSPSPPPGLSSPAPVADAVATELATLLYKQSYGVLFANFAVALPVVYVMRNAAPDWLLASWIAVVYALTLARVLVCHRFLRRGPGPLRPWIRGFCLLSWTSGLLWGLAGVVAVLSGQDMMLAFGCVMLAGMCSGAVPSLSAYPPAYAGSALGMVAPFILVCVAAADGLHLVYAAFGVCLLLVNLYFSAVTYRSLKTTVALRFENTALVRSLELERDRVAAADRAKTRFLAAAGHDLRQPVHALGMFTDILASRAESGNVTAQDALHVARRQQTVLDSLNRLLDGLLDVSRMDAHLLRIEGAPSISISCSTTSAWISHRWPARAACGCRSRPPPWPWTPIRPCCAASSTTCSPMPCRTRPRGRAAVGPPTARRRTDPGLGHRRGDRPELQEAVFTEFTRGAGAPASPPAGQGLGLGLAIVRRLAGLLHGEITLRSMPGKGSVFSLWLPAGIPRRMQPAKINQLIGGRAAL
ncbi:HAMP domain-containing sensor histidine kinase [Achromobacter xylosoxidans]